MSSFSDSAASRAKAVGPELVSPDTSVIAQTPGNDDQSDVWHQQFGVELEERRSALAEFADQFANDLPQSGRPLIGSLTDLLNKQCCRVAVVGQVKAGKSTFLNMLIRRPDLLPTDINPWTTAVTRLHFGIADEPSDIAARFSFFEPSEWQKIWNDGGRLRELVEQFVPGFEPELLREHVNELHRRAETRLGNRLPEYLGRVHEFSALSTGILERYVSADPVEAGETHFADIVKSAELIFQDREFAFPTTLIDTPGTNDPFLVRDEITRRALDAADIHIVVLVARQALSMSDVALLRILRGLHKDRIVVFVNRIDELGDVARDVPAVLDEVRAGLTREFPGADIPVVAGSAYWAELALTGTPADFRDTLTSDVRGYAARDVVGGDDNKANTNLAELKHPAELLMVCSGLPALNRELAKISLSSHASHVLNQIADSMIELGQVTVSGARQELQALTEAQARIQTETPSIEQELADINERVRASEELLAALNTYLLDIGARSTQLVHDRCDVLFDSLSSAVERFARDESLKLKHALSVSTSPGVWKCGTDRIRQHLEYVVFSEFTESTHQFWDLYEKVVPSLQRLLEECLAEGQFLGTDPASRPKSVPPSISALGQVILLDVSDPVWKRWLSMGKTADEQAIRLSETIRRDFRPVIDELVEATHAQLIDLDRIILDDLTRNFLIVVETLQEQSNATLARMTELRNLRDALEEERIAESRAGRMAELDTQIARIEPLIEKLRGLRRQWEETL